MIKEFDFGTRSTESFEAYIKRIEFQIDEILKEKESLNPSLIDVIVRVFEETHLNTPHKLRDVTAFLMHILNREPLLEDYNNLCEYIRQRLQNKRKQETLKLVLNNVKQDNFRDQKRIN